MTTPGQGPLNDPRLIERRGDLNGLNAALFVILVIAAFIAAAYLLATVLHIGGSGASPSPSIGAASPSPAGTIGPSASPSSVPSPTNLASSSAVASGTVGQPLNVVVNGHVIGTVTVVSVQYPNTVVGKAPTSGSRWLAARIRYQAKAGMPYAAADWSVVDGSGTRHAWAGVDFKPALGTGTLKAADKRTGNVTFRVPLTGSLTLAFAGGDGELRVLLPSP